MVRVALRDDETLSDKPLVPSGEAYCTIEEQDNATNRLPFEGCSTTSNTTRMSRPVGCSALGQAKSQVRIRRVA